MPPLVTVAKLVPLVLALLVAQSPIEPLKLSKPVLAQAL